MNILMPMAGAGARFADAGYGVPKPAIPTIERRTGRLLPMACCAAMDLPGVEEGGGNLLFVDRDFHGELGVEDAIRGVFPGARFLTIGRLTEGQACTCLLAKDLVGGGEELLIAGCDSGMDLDAAAFDAARRDADCLVFTYRHNEAVLRNPDAYGWMEADADGNVTGVSVKRAVSDAPMEDHAVAATFWFREGRIFVEAAERMVAAGDRVNGEFYVDEAVRHVLELGYRARVLEVGRYICWGTPGDYEDYMRTLRYWERFVLDERCLIGR